jgi:CheY-like chemotaxis protein
MEMMRRMAEGVAHEFNDILTTIMNAANRILKQFPLESSVTGDLQAIRTAGQQASNLTRQLLAFASRQAIQPRLLNMNDVLLALLKVLQQILGGETELVVLPTPDLRLVKVDPTQVLQARGYTVLEAGNGWDALRMAQNYTEGRIHLLVTDVKMSKMKGDELAERLVYTYPEMKVLFMLEKTDDESVMNMGAAWIKKPFLPDTLVHRVREVLDV